jgi:cytoskeletal protein RodZ
MPIAVLAVFFVVVAVNVFLYFGFYSSRTPTSLPAENTAPSTTTTVPERTGPEERTLPEVTRPERTTPATTLQSTIPADQSATVSATATATSSP